MFFKSLARMEYWKQYICCHGDERRR